MYNNLSWSVFVSQFETVRDRLPLLFTKGAKIFTSLHIAEEFNSEYVNNARAMCDELYSIGYQIIADISPRTLAVFNEPDISILAKKLHLSIVRFDYGFSWEQIINISKKMPICLNASTINLKKIIELKQSKNNIYAMHNYYPRPETGLDSKTFKTINRTLKKHKIPIFAFISGNASLRAPLYEGLPTLEKHRTIAPYAAYVDMVKKYNIQDVFVGDGIITQNEHNFIQYFKTTNILILPIILKKEYEYLHKKNFTIRSDSPKQLLRLQESRQYATKGNTIMPSFTATRIKGAVTIDNERYLRYSGEIQIIKRVLLEDRRVNIIGQIPEQYILLLKHAKKGKKIQFYSEYDNANYKNS